MLDRVEIENFRCLRDVTVELEPLTILIGPNASGKSAVLDALDIHSTFEGNDVWRRRSGVRVERTFISDEGGSHSPRDGDSASRSDGLPASELYYQSLQLDLDALRRKNKASEAAGLDRNGGNLTNVFATLSRERQIEVRDEFCDLVPVYSDVDTRPSGGGYLQLEFSDRWAPDLTYPPDEVSDGSMLMLAYLVLGHQKRSPNIVAVEEPERGLHPYLLGRLVDFFRDLAKGNRGRDPFNIVLATHSPQLLEYADPSEVRLLDREADTGETSIRKPPTDEPNWEATMEQYLGSLGDAWLSGGLGGVPGRN